MQPPRKPSSSTVLRTSGLYNTRTPQAVDPLTKARGVCTTIVRDRIGHLWFDNLSDIAEIQKRFPGLSRLQIEAQVRVYMHERVRRAKAVA